MTSLRACVLSCFSPIRLFVTDSLDCSPAGSYVHGILQARILKWVTLPSFRGSSQPRDQTHISYVFCIGRWVTTSTTWKTQLWPQDWKRSVFTPIPKKDNAKECSNYCTIVLISHASKVILRILQASAIHEP